ncbi:small ribosomal subunit protein bS21c-like isoform X2 [Lycium barbarum]|uniref:small ribosomal subunit protein bS21c-like isoform X2 n=1 Tax=Lycium barbarum TaxID=112863 RepID=UPI00293EEBAA|nr:small ribosomal subunit protein bS21c-like isoform X2 [Lycium barbarum]
MALSLSASLFDPWLNNQHRTNSLPKPVQLNTVSTVPFCVPSLSITVSPVTPTPKLDKDKSDHSYNHLFPSLSFSNILFFKSAYNVQVITGENEPEEKLIGRFRREVLRAGVIQESKRRRFFESTQEKKKRKSRDAARRNRKRRPLPKVLLGDTLETLKDEGYKSDEDKWDLIDVEPPYT